MQLRNFAVFRDLKFESPDTVALLCAGSSSLWYYFFAGLMRQWLKTFFLSSQPVIRLPDCGLSFILGLGWCRLPRLCFPGGAFEQLLKSNLRHENPLSDADGGDISVSGGLVGRIAPNT